MTLHGVDDAVVMKMLKAWPPPPTKIKKEHRTEA